MICLDHDELLQPRRGLTLCFQAPRVNLASPDRESLDELAEREPRQENSRVHAPRQKGRMYLEAEVLVYVPVLGLGRGKVDGFW